MNDVTCRTVFDLTRQEGTIMKIFNRPKFCVLLLAASIMLSCMVVASCEKATDDSRLTEVIKTTASTTNESEFLAFQNKVDEQVAKMDQANIPEGYSYYAGRYIENQKTFIVVVTCSPDTFISDYSNLLDFSFIHVKQVKYTYQELTAAWKTLESEWLKADKRLMNLGIIGHGVNEEKNAVVVDVLELNDEVRAEVAKLIPDPEMVEFQIGEEIHPA